MWWAGTSRAPPPRPMSATPPRTSLGYCGLCVVTTSDSASFVLNWVATTRSAGGRPERQQRRQQARMQAGKQAGSTARQTGRGEEAAAWAQGRERRAGWRAGGQAGRQAAARRAPAPNENPVAFLGRIGSGAAREMAMAVQAEAVPARPMLLRSLSDKFKGLINKCQRTSKPAS
jgi:hypothetical protein